MSKAEDYIKENTKDNANISITYNTYKGISSHSQPWLTPDQARRAVEIAKEKICEKMKFYIESMVSDITFSDINGNDNYDLNKFIEDLKQAIKDE